MFVIVIVVIIIICIENAHKREALKMKPKMFIQFSVVYFLILILILILISHLEHIYLLFVECEQTAHQSDDRMCEKYRYCEDNVSSQHQIKQIQKNRVIKEQTKFNNANINRNINNNNNNMITNVTLKITTLSQARNWVAATSSRGLVFFAGGWNGTTPNDRVDIFNLTNDNSTTTTTTTTIIRMITTLSIPRIEFGIASTNESVFFGGRCHVELNGTTYIRETPEI
jgi:uncharacterized membrane protein